MHVLWPPNHHKALQSEGSSWKGLRAAVTLGREVSGLVPEVELQDAGDLEHEEDEEAEEAQQGHQKEDREGGGKVVDVAGGKRTERNLTMSIRL